MQGMSLFVGVLVGLLLGVLSGAFLRSGTEDIESVSAQSDSSPSASAGAVCEGLVKPISDKELTDRCFLVWANAPDTTFGNTYLGVDTYQNPLDAWVTHEIIFERKPDYILDIGTFQGGSAAL
jgi:hypothetical protein